MNKDPIALIGDCKKQFYQMRVFEDDQERLYQSFSFGDVIFWDYHSL